MTRHSIFLPVITRRQFIRVGMAAMSGFYLESLLQPRNVVASGKVNLRGAADFCIFIFLNGGASQLDTFDLKEGRWTSPDFDTRTTKSGIVMPYGLFPGLAPRGDQLAIVRSIEAWERPMRGLSITCRWGTASAPPGGKRCPRWELSLQASFSQGVENRTFCHLLWP